MLDNHKYNLMNQLSQECKSLWRIQNNYIKDAGDNEEHREIWEKIAQEKERCIEQLETEVKKHME